MILYQKFKKNVKKLVYVIIFRFIINGFANGQFGEVWWFYCSENSTEIDRYVAYDYTERHWLIGNLARTSGTERGVFRYPVMAGHNADSDI